MNHNEHIYALYIFLNHLIYSLIIRHCGFIRYLIRHLNIYYIKCYLTHKVRIHRHELFLCSINSEEIHIFYIEVFKVVLISRKTYLEFMYSCKPAHINYDIQYNKYLYGGIKVCDKTLCHMVMVNERITFILEKVR